MSGPSASGKSTVKTMRIGPAPTERAASITPGVTVSRFCSTMRPMAKDAASEIVKTIASFPMPVPTTNRASGWAAARKMMKGIGRMKFTSRFSITKTGRFSRMLPARVR